MKAILEWETPKSATEVQNFLGSVGYYRRFVKEFSMVTKPLTNFLKKNVPFSWYPQRQQSFEELKKILAIRPIFALLSGNRGFVAYTDASRRGLGSVLMQMGRLSLTHQDHCDLTR